MTIKEVKAKIFETECSEKIREGLCCSEPILTIGDKGLIDNYFIYGRDAKRQHFTRPKNCFGIYTNLNEVAYLDRENEFEEKDYFISEEANIGECFENYDRYVELYPRVREIAYQECNDDDKKMLSEYINCFKQFSGDVLFMFYNKLYPAFFKWVNEQVEELYK